MIQQLSKDRVQETKDLVRRVFPHQGPIESGFHWAWLRQEQPLVRWLMRLAGVAAIEDTWVYVDDAGHVRGTIGLYATTRDSHEARWVSWFCVDPDARGLGIGKALLDNLVAVVRERGWRFLRLYTGSDPDEARAQVLYESRGLREVRRVFKPLWGYHKIYRELELATVAAGVGDQATPRG